MVAQTPNGTYTREDHDKAITDFFNSVPKEFTREICDQNAGKLIREHRDGPVTPIFRQGRHSYTIFNEADPSHNFGIIQYRHADSPLDLSMLDLAQKAHGKLVPHASGTRCLMKTDRPGGAGPDAPSLRRYRIEWRGGLPLDVMLREQSLHPRKYRIQHMKLMRQLAEYFSNALSQGRARRHSFLSERVKELRHAALNVIASSTQHVAAVDQTILASKMAPLLNSAFFPQALAHGELADLSNILVDQSTWAFKGIIDWASAFIWPFGFELYAVQRCTGYWDHDPLPDGAPDEANRDKHRVGEYVWRWFRDAYMLKCIFWRHMARNIVDLSCFNHNRSLVWPWRFGLILSEAFERGPGGEITTTPIPLNDRNEEKMRSLALVQIFLEDQDWITEMQIFDRLLVRSVIEEDASIRMTDVLHDHLAGTENPMPTTYFPEQEGSSPAKSSLNPGLFTRNATDGHSSESVSDLDHDMPIDSPNSDIQRTLANFTGFPPK